MHGDRDALAKHFHGERNTISSKAKKDIKSTPKTPEQIARKKSQAALWQFTSPEEPMDERLEPVHHIHNQAARAFVGMLESISISEDNRSLTFTLNEKYGMGARLQIARHFSGVLESILEDELEIDDAVFLTVDGKLDVEKTGKSYSLKVSVPPLTEEQCDNVAAFDQDLQSRKVKELETASIT